MATREIRVDQRPFPSGIVPADVVFTLPDDVTSEIVVDWQLPSDGDNRPRL